MTTLSERREPVLRVYRARDDIAAADDWGYFGPGSVIWRVNQEAAVGLGLGRALLLQLAHPFVAQAVADHSTFQDEAEERLAATCSVGAASPVKGCPSPPSRCERW